MCIEYLQLNKVIINNEYPLPIIDELFDQLQRANYFSKIELGWCYHPLRVTENDIPETNFRLIYDAWISKQIMVT